MTPVYKDFSKHISALNAVAFAPAAVLTAFGRTYIANGKPYYDNIHFEGHEQPWYILERIHRHIKETPALHGRVYAGAAGEVNLTNMALSKAPAAVLFDINPLQTVFWNDFIAVLAQYPEPEDFAKTMQKFAHDLFFKLRRDFNIVALCKETQGLSMDSPDPNDHLVPVKKQIERARANAKDFGYEFTAEHEKEIKERGPICYGNPERKGSPFRSMSYENFSRWFATMMGWKGEGIYPGEKDLHWLTDRGLYRHLHLMAKHGAMGALTLDVCDAQGCAQLLEFLNAVEYTPLEIDHDGIEHAQARQLGARFGMINFSNICYYLIWNETDLAEQISKHGRACDFTERDVDAQTWRRVIDNWLPLVTPDASILRFDRTSKGLWGRPDFNPTFDITADGSMHIPCPLEKGGLVLDIA